MVKALSTCTDGLQWRTTCTVHVVALLISNSTDTAVLRVLQVLYCTSVLHNLVAVIIALLSCLLVERTEEIVAFLLGLQLSHVVKPHL